ncbi:uncharacterized protein WG66_005797 [Moniliophthora roreri]|nr:uncharacterized protein WG66_005797 [Moniliophthora roreri]
MAYMLATIKIADLSRNNDGPRRIQKRLVTVIIKELVSLHNALRQHQGRQGFYHQHDMLRRLKA